MLIEVDVLVILCEVHEAVSVNMVDEEFVIEIDFVAVVLVGAVGVNLPHNLRMGLRTDFDCEGTVTCICCLVQASEEGVAFHMAEDCLCAV